MSDGYYIAGSLEPKAEEGIAIGGTPVGFVEQIRGAVEFHGRNVVMGKTFQNIKLLKYYVIQLYKMLDAVKVTRLEVKVYSPVCFTARISCTYELRRIEVADSRI